MNIFDNLIQRGLCRPFIAVSPTWDKDNRSKDWGESTREAAVFSQEYVNDLIPAVETRYSTYLESPDEAGILASRNHRAIGGFSLGSITTWYVFEQAFAYSHMYLPMSGDNWSQGMYGEAYQMATQRNTDAINKFNHNSDVIKRQYKNISDLLCELLGRANLFPYEKPKFKDESGHILLNSLYLYPWYCFKCFYSSKHIRGFFKTVAWSVWLISLGLLFFIARDNAILQRQKNINRYVHAYFSDNAEVMMELEGIDLMFSNQEIKPIPVKEYREYMKERKKEVKAKGGKQK